MKSENLGRELRRIRKENKKSLQDVANKLSVSPQAVSQYELSKRDIPDLLLIHMFQSLGVHPGDLVKLISGIEDIPDNEKRKFFDFMHEVDLVSLTTQSLKTGSGSSLAIVPLHSTKTIYNSVFDDQSNNQSISYEISLFHEQNPAILENKDGEFRVDLKIEAQSVIKDFTFNMKYQPASDPRVHMITVFIDKIFPEGMDPLDNNNHYEIYARSINPDFYSNLKISIKKAVDNYFKCVLVRPSTVDLYQDF